MKKAFAAFGTIALFLIFAAPALADPGSGIKGASCSDDLNVRCNAGLACINNICSEIKAPPPAPPPIPGVAGGKCRQGVSPRCDEGLECINEVCAVTAASRISVGCPSGDVNTAIGCIAIRDVNGITAFFLRWGLGIAGGVGLLMIGFASYRIMTSQGDPRRLQGGQELLLSAIGGLLMVVLSVYLLRFMGINLLNIF